MNNPIAKFIDGTASQQSYIVVARKGNVVLGLKPLGLQDGQMTGVPGKTYMFARVRSASAGDLFDELDAETGHKPQNYDFSEAWPTIKFNKKNSERASAIYGAYLDGSLASEPHKVLEQLENGGLIEKMADAVIQMAGEENIVVRYGTLIGWLHEQLDPLIEKYKHQLKVTGEFQQHIDETKGEFGFHQETLKEMLQKGIPTGEQYVDPVEAGTAKEGFTLSDLQAAMTADDDDELDPDLDPGEAHEPVEEDDEDPEQGLDEGDEDK